MFATRLKEALKLAKLSRTQLAERLGVHPMSVQHWCHKRVPRADTVNEIASALGVTSRWLYTGQPPMESKCTDADSVDEPPVSPGKLSFNRDMFLKLLDRMVTEEDQAVRAAFAEMLRGELSTM